MTQKLNSTIRSVEDCGLHPNYKNDFDLNNNFSDQTVYGTPIDIEGNEYQKKESVDKFADIYTKFDNHIQVGSIRGHLKGIVYRPHSYKIHDFWEDIFDRQNPLDLFNQTISKSKYILELEKGWDDADAPRIEPLLFNTACKCISNYIESIYKEKFFVIQSPEIAPVADGSLDFSWQLDNARMLINFRSFNEEVFAYFYGDLKDNKIPIKGNVPAKEVFEHLMKWMQYLK
ncbi:hypothetical protein [Pedobacter sp. Leaf176]|uniref:hypothetical protein n=1 Tax=Pedobacter sp. Leaf176 TaxID=1736286 RepID=UPI0012F76589|nr:hypothetical protein [Pedobacter sp. Leaf176]